jgi:hypothetical protein
MIIYQLQEKSLTIDARLVVIGRDRPTGAVIGRRRGEIGQPAR